MSDRRHRLDFLLDEEENNLLSNVYNTALDNSIFNQIHQTQPPNNVVRGGVVTNNITPWRAAWVTPEAGNLSSYTYRLRMTYNADNMLPPVILPPVPPASFTPAAVDAYFRDHSTWPIIENFLTVLRAQVEEFDTRVNSLRVYLIHEDGSLEVLEDPDIAATGRHAVRFMLTSGWKERLKRGLAMALSAFSDYYFLYSGDLSYIQVYVDIAFSAGGSGRSVNQKLPDWMPDGLSSIIFNPVSKDCFIKCLHQKMKTLTHHVLKRLMGPTNDIDYFKVAEKFRAEFKGWGLRVTNRMFHILISVDGDAFKMIPYSPDKISRVIWLVLDNQHYFLVNDPQTYLRTVRGGRWLNSLICLICGQVYTTNEALESCECRPSACDQCDRMIQSPADQQYHKLRDDSTKDLTCEYCEYAGFYSEKCLDYHKLVCVARISQNVQIAQLGAAATFLENLKNQPDRQLEYEVAKTKYDQRLNATLNGSRTTCPNCKKKYYKEINHECFMHANELPEELKIKKWFAFDYESMLLPVAADILRHQVNLVCVQEMFTRPITRWVFKTITEFFSWIKAQIIPLDLDVAFIAHNLKGYDGRLTLAELFKNQEEVDNMTWNGSKIQAFTWLQKIHFRDSLLHIAQPLASFPKVFGLSEMKKGYFPYIFNTLENQTYIGTLPAIKYYEPEFKNPSERSKFLTWHAEHSNDVYDFQKELIAYCISDVDILAQALEKYTTAGMQLNDPRLPPLENLTTASYTLNCWKTLHFTENSLAYHTVSREKNARDALRGGRTDVRVFYKKWTMEDVFVHQKYGKYVDVQSMYPYVMYVKPVPIGVPILDYKIPEEKWLDTINQKFGFACVDLDPPNTYVHHPPIVHKYQDRLVAHLKPWLKTVFTIVEIKDALDCGWILKKLHWCQWYEKNSSELFKEYIRKLVSEKIQSSGGPPDDFDEFAKEWEERFGVIIERSKMELNPGKRAIAKFQVNSLWGKIAERPHCAKVEFVDSQGFMALERKEELGEIRFRHKYWMADDRWLIDYEVLVKRGKTGQIVAPYRDITLRNNRLKTNVAIGSFVTMWGRRMLWEEMRRLGRRTMYHDTDSIIYEYSASETYNTPTGRCLGDWEEELPGKPIIEFVALAPKTYGYRYLEGAIDIPTDASDSWFQQYQPYEIWGSKLYPVKEVVKVKGFRLHSEAKEAINFDGLLSLLRKEKTNLTARQLQFSYDRKMGEITSKISRKCLVMDYEKGEIGADLCGYPYGYESYIPTSSGVVEEGSLRRPVRHAADLE